ncbi:tetratricopeptide repeat protein [Nannocystis pusilla]|uniref:tetratricopeptide repeat protein n=1 Tax=Nannocystis pusilla TaxID=889268 RepID=UPI003B786B30
MTDRLGPFTIASPMGAPSAEAVGELVMPHDVPAPRARPSSSVIVRRREHSGAIPTVSALESSLSGNQPLLSDSAADLGRLNDLVAQTLAMNSGVNPAPAPSQLSAASFAVAAEEVPRRRSLWPWGLMAVGTAAAMAALLWRPTAADVPRDRSVQAVAGKPAPPEPVAGSEPGPTKAEPTKVEPTKAEPPVQVTPPAPAPPEPTKAEPTNAETPPEPSAISAEQQAKLEQAQKQYKNGRAKDAEATLVELVTEAPRYAEAQALLANARLDQGKFAEALPAAKAAVEADANLADAQLALGVIAEELGEVATAVHAYERYLELDPKARYATTVRAQLRSLQRKLLRRDRPGRWPLLASSRSNRRVTRRPAPWSRGCSCARAWWRRKSSCTRSSVAWCRSWRAATT